MPAWVLRSGTAADASAVVELWLASGAEPTSTDDPASVHILLARDPEALIVADARGQIVGTVIAGFDGWRGNLYRLVVAPEWRRQGIASELVAEAERRLTGGQASRSNARAGSKSWFAGSRRCRCRPACSAPCQVARNWSKSIAGSAIALYLLDGLRWTNPSPVA
jgi:GNAT superfamily N-acetyltransferase